MNHRKNGVTTARGADQRYAQQAGLLPKPGVAQPKKVGAAQTPKTPAAPPRVVQPRMATPVLTRQPPIAPPVYRPQRVAKVAQPKAANGVQPNRKPPIAPPIYRPQQIPKVLQTKSAMSQQSKTGHSPRKPAAPPVSPRQAVQTKRLAVSVPPAFRPMKLAPTKSMRAGLAIRGFRSSVINLMAEVAAPYLETALTYEYSAVEALLQADEQTELDELWSANYQVTRNTSNSTRRTRGRNAAATVRTRLNAILAIPLVTYSVNFRTNHLSDADVIASTAKTKGEARNPIPPHNTVLKESYLRGLLLADVGAKVDGEYWLAFQSPHPANGKISLATRRDAHTMDAEDTGLYFGRVKYELSTVGGSRRQRRVRAFHMETDDD